MPSHHVYTARDAFEAIPYLHADIELFYVLYLGRDFAYLGYNVLTGSRDHVFVRPLPHFTDNARRLDAKKLVIAHTHPCGVLRPSPEDLDLTLSFSRVVAEAGLFLLDHLILCWPHWYSMRGHGHFGHACTEGRP